MQKVTGIGGIVFKSKDPEALRKWYTENLGIDMEHGYIEFKWADDPMATAGGSTTFGIFKADSDEFKPSEKDFLINLRVSDVKALVAELKAKGVTVGDEVQEYDFGLFSWCMDPELNKLQLWEPVDNSPAK